MKLIVVSGRSGSGKSIALNALEDLGYYCIDNIPVTLLPSLLAQFSNKHTDIAVSVDARNAHDELSQFSAVMDGIDHNQVHSTIVFLDADDTTLLKRFSETRRRHPLTKQGIALADAIAKERSLLDDVISRSDHLIDTSKLTPHQLKELIRVRLLNLEDNHLTLQFESFGFKHGVPSDADFVFDARCLPNPYWDPELRPLVGTDQPIIDFLSEDNMVLEYIWQLQVFLQTWIPRFATSNRSYITVAIGCTGGQHRSVYITEQLAQHFAERYNNIHIKHRELS